MSRVNLFPDLSATYSDIVQSLSDITINSGGEPADGAVPVWDGAQFVWSATQSPYMTPDGFDYLQPDGVGRYLAP